MEELLKVLNIQDILPPHTGDILSGLGQLFMGLGIFGSMLMSWRNGRKIEEVKKATIEVKEATNGMKSELVATVAKAAKSEGREDERREARERNENRKD